MKKIIIILSMCFSICYGQLNQDSILNSKYLYCELLGTEKLFSKKINLVIDYGEELEYFKDNRLKDEQTGKLAKFNSMVDALNYMGKQGWEFVQAYVVTVGNQNVYRWLLKKKTK